MIAAVTILAALAALALAAHWHHRHRPRAHPPEYVSWRTLARYRELEHEDEK